MASITISIGRQGMWNDVAAAAADARSYTTAVQRLGIAASIQRWCRIDH